MHPVQGISIIMPVFNGTGTLDRAIKSVVAQTDPDWELLTVDDGSTDDSHSALCRWAARDPRIRPFRLASNRGPAAARNEALRHARGELIAYLDCDDEFYPTYLGLVRRWQGKADVLLFAYDQIEDGVPAAGSEARTWDPAPVLAELMAKNIATPLGVAHRRSLMDRVGGFEESLRYEQDWDLWKRFALAGATFHCVRAKSGLYHVRSDSHSRLRPVAARAAIPTDLC